MKMKRAKKQKIRKKRSQPEPRRHEVVRPVDPVLRFTPYAWAKLYWFCHHGDTEIAGFGVTSAKDLLLIEDFVTVQQTASCISVSFDDDAVADFFEDQVDAGRRPEQFARIWLHTHPGSSPTPSLIDEATFSRVFGQCDWAMMFILAREGKTFARLRFNVGPGSEAVVPVEIEFSQPFDGSDHLTWLQEYEGNIQAESVPLAPVEIGFKQPAWNDPTTDPTVEQEDLKRFALTQNMSPDDIDRLFDESEVFL